MKHRKETITALLFLAATLLAFCYVGYLALTGQSAFRKELGLLRRDPGYVTEFVSTAEGKLNEDLDREHGFIQLYGGFQRLAGRRVLEDVDLSARVVKLKNGALNFAYLSVEPIDIAPQAGAVNGLSQALEARDIPFLYVAAPQKIPSGADLLPTGLREYGNDNGDRLLAALDEAGTDTLDLRPLFEATEDYSSWFFRTDHHWKPEAAFLAWQHLTRVLEEDYGIITDPLCTDESQYDKVVYEDWFLGSQGKRCGSLYAGVDDITAYIPRFETDFTYTCPFYAIDRSGPFEESLLFPERVAERDWFNGNPYTLYAGGDYPQATIVNHRNPDGKRVVLLRESFACAMTPFLALSCSELTTIDLRSFQGDLLETIEGLRPDLVMVLYSVSSIGSQPLFQFGLEAP
ncbi:MAG: DHHW family protein [Clostridiales bacterium]|nr:DHHW family protein [Clostridiales bacterium]